MRTLLPSLGLCALVTLAAGPARGQTTTVGNGVQGPSAPVCPGATDVRLDGFSLVTDTGNSQVTLLAVTLTNYTAIQSLSIWSEDGATQYFQTAGPPTSNTVNFTGPPNIPVSAALANFKIVASYRSHAQAPIAKTTTTAYVSAIKTTTNNVVLNDSPDTTITLNNAMPNPAKWTATTPLDGKVTLNWTLGSSTDSVMVVRYSTSSDSTMPTDGATYSVGSSFGSGTIVHIGNDISYTDTSVSNGNTYYYRIFEYDSCLNYNTTTPWSSPLVPKAVTTLADGIAGASNTVCPGDSNKKLGGFSLMNSQGTTNVTGLTVTLGNTPSAYQAIQSLSIWDEAGTHQYYSTVSPTSNTVNFSGGNSIQPPNAFANYKIVANYSGHQAPLGSIATTAYVSKLRLRIISRVPIPWTPRSRSTMPRRVQPNGARPRSAKTRSP